MSTPTMQTRTITVTVPLTDEALSDILVTAYEGGIGYWFRGLNHKRTERGYDWIAGYVSDEAAEETGVDNFYGSEGLDDAVEAGRAPESVTLIDFDTVAEGVRLILSGEVGISPDLFAQVGTLVHPDLTDIDSSAADCIVQAGLFGEIVYG